MVIMSENNKYGLIGKKVELNSDVITAYRFVNLKTNKTVDVSVNNLKSFMASNFVTNASLDAYGNLCFKFQNIYHFPVFREDGGVSTYYYKVILERLHNGKYLLGNITGSITEVSLPLYLFKIYNLNSPIGLIVDTPQRCSKFTMCMDGSYKSEVIDGNSIYNKNDFTFDTIEENRMRVYYNLSECEYNNDIYYYYSNLNLDVRHGLLLTCSKLVGQVTLLYGKSYSHVNNGYQLKSSPFDSNDYNTMETVYNVTSLNKLSKNNNHFMIGIDGLTCLGNDFGNLHNEEIEDYYNGLLLMSPDDAHLFKNNIKVGNNNDLVYCNLGLINIPDCIETVGSESLCFNFDNYLTRFRELLDNPSKCEDVVIPASVKNFSNTAFKSVKAKYSYVSNSAYNNIAKNEYVRVENVGIAKNVINAIVNSNIKFKGIMIKGSLDLDCGLVKRIFEYRIPVVADNFKCLPCITDKKSKAKSNGDVPVFKVKPFAENSNNYSILFFDNDVDFNAVYADKVKELNVKYSTLRQEVNALLSAKAINKKKFIEYERMLRALYNEYKAYFDMISRCAMKDGDVNNYYTLCTSMSSRLSNLNSLLNEKLKLIKLDKKTVWDNNKN